MLEGAVNRQTATNSQLHVPTQLPAESHTPVLHSVPAGRLVYRQSLASQPGLASAWHSPGGGQPSQALFGTMSMQLPAPSQLPVLHSVQAAS
jgi:hypothetical protein